MRLTKGSWKGRRSLLPCGLVLLILVFSIGSLAGCITGSGDIDNTKAPQETSNAAPVVLFDEDTIVALYDRTAQAVVEVNTTFNNGDDPDIFDPFPRTGQGSGFLIDNEGHILTNYHVTGDEPDVKVTLSDGRILDAIVKGIDKEDDLALLKVDPREIEGIAPLPLGDSELVRPGQMAVALGSPFGLQGSITVGIISGVERSLTGVSQRTITDMLQTDAAINFGNSGGPLLSSSGEVIGINTAIQASSSQATGIGYAVPINTAKSVIPSLKEGKDIHRPWLGISGLAITPELSEALDLPTETGVYVISVTPDSPADKSNLNGSGADGYGQPSQGGDIITAVDAEPVANVEDLLRYFNGKKPGDEVSLSIYRNDDLIHVTVTLDEWPEEFPAPGIERMPLPEDFDLDEFHQWREDDTD